MRPSTRSAGDEICNAFTVDVEDYFQVSAFEGQVRRDDWHQYACRVVQNTRRILRLLERHQTRATFFVLGWIAERYPDLVREIHRSGHEIGSHGYWHRLVYEQTPEGFRRDVRQSREILEGVIGQRVALYRAPSFSITGKSLWALEILVEEGFRIDCSIFPVRHDRYGMPQAETSIHQIATAAGPLWEFPPAVVRLAGLKLPVAGGGYFRLFPLAFTLGALARINRRLRQPFLFYVHPWELDPRQPRIANVSRISRARHYVNLASTEKKLEVLLSRFRFAQVSEAVHRTVPEGAFPAEVSKASL